MDPFIIFGLSSLLRFDYYLLLVGFSSSCLVQPIMLNEKTENADFEALVLGDERSIEFKRVVWSAPKAQANLKKLIPFYDRLGVFD